MLIQGGKANWLAFISKVNGFEIHTGLGSHLPGVASFTSPARIADGLFMPEDTGPERPIIGLGPS